MVHYIFIPFLLFSFLSPLGAAANGPKENPAETNKQNQHGKHAHPSSNQKTESKEQKEAGPANNSQNKPNKEAVPAQKPPNQTKPPSQEPNVAEKENANKPPSPEHNVPGKEKANKPPSEIKQEHNPAKENANKVIGNTNGNKSTQIHLHLNKCTRSADHVYVEINGDWEEMYTQGNSPLYKLEDHGEYVKDDITAFKIVTSNDADNYSVDEIKVGVEAQGTINYWLEKCNNPSKPGEENTNPPGKANPPGSNPNPPGKTNPPGGPTDGKEPAPSKDKETNAGVVTEIKKENEVQYSGDLPKTGESSPVGYYLIGLLVAATGFYILWTCRTDKA